MAEEQGGLRRLLSLRGRCSRAANGWFVLVSFVCFAAALLVALAAGLPLLPTVVVTVMVLAAPGFIFSIRRLHDVGLSGWFILLFAVPIVGGIFSWSVVFKRGQVGANKYGDPPLKTAASRPSKPGREWALAVSGSVAVFAALLSFRIFGFQPYTIPSAAMEPSLSVGDYVFVSKAAYGVSKHSFPFSPPLFHGRIFNRAPRRGDIVVFKLPRDPKVDYIKRLIGLPGDRVQIRSGVVFVNGRPMDRKQVGASTESMGGGFDVPVDVYQETTSEGRSYRTYSYGKNQVSENTGVYVVPPHCYFTIGDNRDNSLDSRFDPGMAFEATGPSNCGWDNAVDAYVPDEKGVGFVPEENLVGQAELAVALTGKPRLRWLAGR
ncbi:signal peptidase I [Phenylobacterium montanum]|uniref:Signal peptidase I n=1 Tax=Phenylobacterium montanum TaxID=2823693 RepID=A0A975G4L1_9CAUL|nr:signal peptidase I [Caulobacter sp. S6]QUD90473.1 signal peptidase I [Caulobacter sp. S6]